MNIWETLFKVNTIYQLAQAADGKQSWTRAFWMIILFWFVRPILFILFWVFLFGFSPIMQIGMNVYKGIPFNQIAMPTIRCFYFDDKHACNVKQLMYLENEDRIANQEKIDQQKDHQQFLDDMNRQTVEQEQHDIYNPDVERQLRKEKVLKDLEDEDK